mmetsp:Transcript_49648/g.142396  ORF Transcript_49648/g.142396 Transcript_49648/m.142396 type:complete len:388 (-) Transcript_49648:415-1578(-)
MTAGTCSGSSHVLSKARRKTNPSSVRRCARNKRASSANNAGISSVRSSSVGLMRRSKWDHSALSRTASKVRRCTNRASGVALRSSDAGLRRAKSWRALAAAAEAAAAASPAASPSEAGVSWRLPWPASRGRLNSKTGPALLVRRRKYLSKAALVSRFRYSSSASPCADRSSPSAAPQKATNARARTSAESEAEGRAQPRRCFSMSSSIKDVCPNRLCAKTWKASQRSRGTNFRSGSASVSPSTISGNACTSYKFAMASAQAMRTCGRLSKIRPKITGKTEDSRAKPNEELEAMSKTTDRTLSLTSSAGSKQRSAKHALMRSAARPQASVPLVDAPWPLPPPRFLSCTSRLRQGTAVASMSLAPSSATCRTSSLASVRRSRCRSKRIG